MKVDINCWQQVQRVGGATRSASTLWLLVHSAPAKSANLREFCAGPRVALEEIVMSYDEPAPETLRSVPCTTDVRDVEVSVEIAESGEWPVAEPASPPSLLQALLDSCPPYDADGLPTPRYARAA